MTTTRCRFTACTPRPCSPKTRMPTALPGTQSLKTCCASLVGASCLPRQPASLYIDRRCRSACHSIGHASQHLGDAKLASHACKHGSKQHRLRVLGSCVSALQYANAIWNKHLLHAHQYDSSSNATTSAGIVSGAVL